MRRSTQLWPGRVRAAFSETLGEAARVDEGFGPITVDVAAQSWEEALEIARDGLDCTFFDWLSAVDELNDGFRIVCHLADHRIGGVDHLVIRTLVPRNAAVVPSVAHLFAGARWHERETHEMFGIDFSVEGAPLELKPLLLPENFEGHPLRKDFILASRVAKPFPGAKEPGESDSPAPGAAPPRRRTRPPGVPEPEQWGPRDPGTDAPDTLAAAASAGPARPRRAPRPSPAVEPDAERGTAPAVGPDGEGGAVVDGPGVPPTGESDGEGGAPPAAGPDGGGGGAVDGPGSPATKEQGRMGPPPSTGGPTDGDDPKPAGGPADGDDPKPAGGSIDGGPQQEGPDG